MFSDISLFLRTKSTFFYLINKLFGRVWRPLKNLKTLMSKFFLEFCQMIAQKLEILSNDSTKEWFSECVNNKGFGFLENTISQFDFKVVGSSKKLGSLSTANGLLIFLILFV